MGPIECNSQDKLLVMGTVIKKVSDKPYLTKFVHITIHIAHSI